MSDVPLLKIENLNVYYGSSHILQGISLVLEKGVVSLVGRNGMGKTTLVKSIMGLVPVESGAVYLNGENVTNLKPYQIAARHVGYVPQGRELFESLTVDEHLRIFAKKGAAGEWTVDRIYDIFPRLYDRKNLGGMSLSGGEQQMLAIGRALMTNPSLLIMDEPSEGLAPVIVDLVIENLRMLMKSGMSILLIEQNLHTATPLVEELYVVVGGRIVTRIKSDLLMNDQDLRERYLGVRIQKSG